MKEALEEMVARRIFDYLAPDNSFYYHEANFSSYQKAARAVLRTIRTETARAALHAGAEGWILLPRRLTPEMGEAIATSMLVSETVQHLWDSVLAAAPSPSSEQVCPTCGKVQLEQGARQDRKPSREGSDQFVDDAQLIDRLMREQ